MAMEGILNYLDVAHLFRVVGSARKSGVLHTWWEDREARLFFDRGELIRAESNRFGDGIGTLLVRADLLSPEDLDRALVRQRAEGGARRLGAILCDDFGLRAEDIEAVLCRQFERIAFDVFSWPGGRFVFRFHEPQVLEERFRFEPGEFILHVGIKAGLLAEQGLERHEESA